MKSLFSVCVFAFLLLCVFAQHNEQKTYEGYKVVRLLLTGNSTKIQDSMHSIYTTAEKYNLDIWAMNLVEGWADVMIQPVLAGSIEAIFPSFSYVISIEDVQESIDENERERELSNKQDDIFTNFQTYGRIVQWMEEQVAKSGGLFELISIGNSYLGNPIRGIHMAKSQSNDKSTVIIQCGIHAREWITPTHCLWIIDQLANTDPDRARLLNKLEFVIVPVLNIDGYDFTFTSNRLWRKNRQPNSGSSCIGTDLNRNYGFGWSGPGASNNPCAETYYGARAYSAPEVAASRDLVETHVGRGTLVSFWDLHAYGSLWMSAWGYTCNQLPPDFTEMNNAMTQAVAECRKVNGNNYAFGAICRTIYQASGSSVDFGYGDGGVIHSYTTEAFGNNFTPPPSYIPTVGAEVWAGLKKTCDIIS